MHEVPKIPKDNQECLKILNCIGTEGPEGTFQEKESVPQEVIQNLQTMSPMSLFLGKNFSWCGLHISKGMIYCEAPE